MARTNYSYEKRQRELAKKKKKEEKRLKKTQADDANPPVDEDGNPLPANDQPAPGQPPAD